MSVSFREQLGERICVAEPTDRAPTAQVLFVHGLSDHLGRQLRSLSWLAGLGYRGIGIELRGHGGQPSAWADSCWVYEAYQESETARETLGRLAGAAPGERARIPALAKAQYQLLRGLGAEDHQAQLDRALEIARGLDSSLPLVLMGHSMGALLSLDAAWRWQRRPDADLRGVALLSPALEPRGRPGSRVEGLVFDTVWRLRKSPFSLTRAAFKAVLDLNVPVDTTWGNRWVSDLADEVALSGTDPLIPHWLPTRYASTIESLMLATERRGFALPVPGLVVVPETDGITSVSAGSRFARSVQDAVGPDRLRLVQLAGLCAHDLFRSSARERARVVIGDWLAALLQPPASERVGEVHAL